MQGGGGAKRPRPARGYDGRATRDGGAGEPRGRTAGSCPECNRDTPHPRGSWHRHAPGRSGAEDGGRRGRLSARPAFYPGCSSPEPGRRAQEPDQLRADLLGAPGAAPLNRAGAGPRVVFGIIRGGRDVRFSCHAHRSHEPTCKSVTAVGRAVIPEQHLFGPLPGARQFWRRQAGRRGRQRTSYPLWTRIPGLLHAARKPADHSALRRRQGQPCQGHRLGPDAGEGGVG